MANRRLAGLSTTRYYATKIWIYELGLIYHFRPDRTNVAPQLAFGSDQSDFVKSLTRCVDAIKGYLDSFLTLESESDILPFEEWLRLILACFVLYKLSVRLPEVTAWNFEYARRTIDLEAYLAALISHIRTARCEANQPDTMVGENLYAVLPEVLETAKASYVATRDAPHRHRSDAKVHMDLTVPRRSQIMENISTMSGTSKSVRCPATGCWANLASDEDRHDELYGLVLPQSTSASVRQLENDKLWSEFLTMDMTS